MARVGFQMPCPLESSAQTTDDVNDLEKSGASTKSPTEEYVPISVPHEMPKHQADATAQQSLMKLPHSCRAICKNCLYSLLFASALFLYIVISKACSWNWHGEPQAAVLSLPLQTSWQLLITPKVSCAEDPPFAALMVMTGAADSEGRMLVRNTWGGATHVSNRRVRLFFLLGAQGTPELQKTVETEAEEYGDILQHAAPDKYTNLATKTATMIQWMAVSCPEAKFLVKADTDTLVNLDVMIPYLVKMENSGDLALGARLDNMPLITSENSRNYQDPLVFPRKTFPPYLSGNMEQNQAGPGSPLDGSQPSSGPNTMRSVTPKATYSVGTAGKVPETRPARLILRPYDTSNAGYTTMAPMQSSRSEGLRYYNAQAASPSCFKQQPQPFCNDSIEDVPLKGQAAYSQPRKPLISTLPAVQEPPQRTPVSVGRATMPVNAFDLPPPLLQNKSPKEQNFLRNWNRVDHAGAVATCRLERVPLPMLERVPGGSGRLRLQGPLVKVKLPHVPSVEGDLRRFCQRIVSAFSGAADDCRRLFVPCTQLRLPRFECCAPQTPVLQECRSCGYKGHFCPECGTGPNGPRMAAGGAPFARVQPSRGVLVAQEGCLERCMRWHCSLFEEVGDAIDQEILCDRAGSVFRECGEFIDNLVAEGIHAISFNCASLCGAIPGRSRILVDGYPMYEPDPLFLRKERPTSATGNACVDQVNAFLDACLAERSKYTQDLPPPPIPDTQKTGNWLIDATNAALDYCLQERTPPPPPPRKKVCPLEMLIPPCCRERPPVVVPPPKQGPKEQIGGCQIQFCPVREPEITVVPTGPALVYPYREEEFQVRDPSGLVEALDDHGEGVQLPRKLVLTEPVM
ncbi:hypothetical protein, conserved [Eimeria brunetti]|uniref:Uncharacterized protein n=1 Tax=Eimeria brunetti TaxID=51314 RepID=U6LGS6_9EIME|nr:hypothetical protein, conserved [Eimeria brunetti]